MRSRFGGGLTYHLKDNPDHQTAAWTDGDVFFVSQVGQGDFEAVATRARVVVDLESRVEGHVLDFDLIVNILGHFGQDLRACGAVLYCMYCAVLGWRALGQVWDVLEDAGLVVVVRKEILMPPGRIVAYLALHNLARW